MTVENITTGAKKSTIYRLSFSDFFLKATYAPRMVVYHRHFVQTDPVSLKGKLLQFRLQCVGHLFSIHSIFLHESLLFLPKSRK